MNAKGIDISHWQGTTPSLAGLDFLIARASYANSPDDKYQLHYSNARKAGLVVGTFHFGVGAAQASLVAQAAAFLTAAGGADFLALDLESNGKNGPSMTTLEARSFIALVRNTDPRKRKIALYHSLAAYPSLGQDLNWIADWNPAPPGIGWDFWQYRGNPLDLDVFNGDRAALNALVAGGSNTSTVTFNTPIVAGTLTVLPDPAIRWVDLATGQLMGPLHLSAPIPAVAGTVSPGIGTETHGYQVTINGKPSFLLGRNVTFTPAPDPTTLQAALDVAVKSAASAASVLAQVKALVNA